jgi:hypothetical protein
MDWTSVTLPAQTGNKPAAGEEDSNAESEDGEYVPPDDWMGDDDY